MDERVEVDLWLQIMMSTKLTIIDKRNFQHSGAKVAGTKWSDRWQKSAGYQVLMTTLQLLLMSLWAGALKIGKILLNNLGKMGS